MTGFEDGPELRQSIIDACRWMNARGINQGTSGNISVRLTDGMLITPSGIPYDALMPEMLVTMPLSGGADSGGPVRPSSEWRFHQALLRSRRDMRVVVHAHPAHATAVAMQGRPIPACHYMVAAFGGSDLPIAPYALFGSEALAEHMRRTLETRHGCLMESHGATVLGESIERALWRMEELENIARIYLLSRQDGQPKLLSEAQMQEVIAAFAGYGPGR
ncbi:class II aldolase/adducin family protein [Limimaricola pyoseonensis]|uniref:L-fuculose-phosphate aldolase n=1 Tax=Limimaricola pyoseonensis TaxID=521013 RepID=A0A1G7FLQ0_9RHOB|nr:class II aldolase/adducin family protein [Limimaricola pyoseonensis]SDE76871.1 L-fuculose-phosphate aldolase [Limimaricola pyoseonensis]